MKRFLKYTALAILLLIIAAIAVKERADATYFDDYDPALPFNEKIAETTDQDGFRLVKFYFDARPGEAVPTLMTLPPAHDGKLPVVIFLHGIGQEKSFLTEITRPFNDNGFAMVCFDQYARGERTLEKMNPIGEVRAFRARAWKTVNDTRRLVDYLAAHPDMDPARIYLVGASYGAITGSTAAALDPRIKATVLVYGAGDLSKMLDAVAITQEVEKIASTRPMLGSLWKPIVKPLAVYLLDPADPLHNIGKIAPRPVYFQNGTHDILIATPAAEAYQKAAGDPKEIKWYDSDHVGLDENNTREVLHDGLLWLLKQDGRPLAPPPVEELPPGAA